MRALGRAGRRRDALDAYEEARQLLADELGVEPGEELRHAHEAVLADELDALGRVEPRDTPVPFVGRIAESGRLEAALERCRTGGLQFVVVTGEPGIGKTRLAEDFANRVRRAGDEILFGACDRTAAVPLRAVLMALGPVVDDPRLEPLGPMLDDLRYLLGRVEHSTALDEQLDERARRFTIVIGAALEALARRRPLVLVVDDVQWADRSTLALLEHLATERAGMAALVVCTHRDTELDSESRERFFVDLGRTTPIEWMALGALRPDELRVLADLVSDASPDPAFTELLRHASGGNPLHVVQLARLLAASGGVLPRPLPRDLTAVLRARVESLSAETRSLLGVAAVVGDEFTVDLVAHVRGRDDLDVAEALETAHHARLVEPTDAFDRYRFVHGLVRQMLYDDLDESRCVRLHAAAARGCRGSGTSDPSKPRCIWPTRARSCPKPRCSGRSSPVRVRRLPSPRSTLRRGCTGSRPSSSCPVPRTPPSSTSHWAMSRWPAATPISAGPVSRPVKRSRGSWTAGTSSRTPFSPSVGSASHPRSPTRAARREGARGARPSRRAATPSVAFRCGAGSRT